VEKTMPFTPFHFGPGLFFGIPLRKYIHVPTFIFANVLLDIEPLIVLITGINCPLHGYLHTFAAAIGVGALFGLGVFVIERSMRPIYVKLLLDPDIKFSKLQFVTAGVLATLLHVLLDSPLYSDIKPFFPLSANPLYGAAYSIEIYLLSIWMGIFGIAFYIVLLIVSGYKKRRTNHQRKNAAG
jgi:hypothetical protein